VATEAAQNGRTDVRADRIQTSAALRGGWMGAEPLPYAGGHPLGTPIPHEILWAIVENQLWARDSFFRLGFPTPQSCAYPEYSARQGPTRLADKSDRVGGRIE
jgi:hypothetical protein